VFSYRVVFRGGVVSGKVVSGAAGEVFEALLTTLERLLLQAINVSMTAPNKVAVKMGRIMRTSSLSYSERPFSSLQFPIFRHDLLRPTSAGKYQIGWRRRI